MNDPVRVNLEYEVVRPNQERAYIVPRTEWLRLMDRLQRAAGASAFYDSAGWASLGIAGTVFFGGFTVERGPWRLATWAFGLAFFLTGLLSLHFARQHYGDRTALLRSVVDDMRAKAGADPDDTAGERRTYRAVAYLRNYLREAVTNEQPFTPEVVKWEVHSGARNMKLSVRRREGQAYTASVEVAPDWPTGESWSYAIKLGRQLMSQLPSELVALSLEQWRGGEHRSSAEF